MFFLHMGCQLHAGAAPTAAGCPYCGWLPLLRLAAATAAGCRYCGWLLLTAYGYCGWLPLLWLPLLLTAYRYCGWLPLLRLAAVTAAAQCTERSPSCVPIVTQPKDYEG